MLHNYDNTHYYCHIFVCLFLVFFCGSEGYLEFLNSKWMNEIVSWGSTKGCYSPEDDRVSRRSANYVEFGCTDHATGLGAAALGLNLRYILYHLRSEEYK